MWMKSKSKQIKAYELNKKINEEKILEWYEKRMPEYKGIGKKSYQKILEKF